MVCAICNLLGSIFLSLPLFLSLGALAVGSVDERIFYFLLYSIRRDLTTILSFVGRQANAVRREIL